MAVLIDIPMPASCRDCPVYSRGVCRLALIGIKNEGQRSEFCPLVEVQKPKRIMSREAMEAAGFEV